MREIGGYFGLEGSLNKDYHFGDNVLKLNNARNCLKYLIKNYKYKSMYIPYYICDSVLNVLDEEKVEVLFYSLNENFVPMDLENFNKDIPLLYVNYFGVNSKNLAYISNLHSNLIVDNSQAFFFDCEHKNIAQFYSCRKFLGVPDGAYLEINDKNFKEVEPVSAFDVSYDRYTYILKRIDTSAGEAYGDFQENEEYHDNIDIKLMSKTTERFLSLLDYDFIKNQRKANFEKLHNELSKYNELNIDSTVSQNAPLCYPFLVSKDGLRELLIENKVFVARYWPNVLDLENKDDFEYRLGKYLLPLPIDQRYNSDDMQYIIDIVKDKLDE